MVAPEILLPTGFFSITIIYRKILHLWDHPGDLTNKMNEYHMRFIWMDVRCTTMVKILESTLELFLVLEEGVFKKP